MSSLDHSILGFENTEKMLVDTKICFVRSRSAHLPILRLEYDNRSQGVVVDKPVKGMGILVVKAVEYAEAYRHLNGKVQLLQRVQRKKLNWAAYIVITPIPNCRLHRKREVIAVVRLWPPHTVS